MIGPGLLVPACLVLTLGAGGLTASQTARTLPSQPGVAVGTLQAGPAKIVLAHAYALASEDASGPIYRLLLTDGPIPPEMISKELQRGGQTLLKTGKLSGLSLLVGPDGFIRSIVPYAGQMRGSQMLASAGPLTSFAVKATTATGEGSLTSDRTMGQGWSYTVSFNAALVTEK